MLTKLKPKSEFSRNVLTLMTGTTIAQVIPIAISPILTRIYTPEDFGIFAFYMSIVSILSIVVTGRYELAIVLPKKDSDAFHLLILSIGLSLIGSLFIFILIYLFGNYISGIFTTKNISNWYYYIPLGIFATSIYQIFSYWFNRKERYKQLSTNIISQNIGMSFFQIFLSFIEKFKSIGLIFGYILGQLISSILFISYFYKYDFRSNEFLKKEIFNQLILYKDYPLKNIPGAFINAFASQIPIIMIGIFYSPTLAGFYMMAMKILNIPMVFLGRAFSQVFYKKAVLKKEENSLYPFVVKNTKLLFFIIILPMLILFIFGEDIFVLAFGKEWIVSGEITKLLIPMILFGFVYSAQSTLIMVLDRLEYQIYFSVVLIFLQSLGFMIGFYIFHSYSVSIFLLSFTGMIVYVYNIYWMLNESKYLNKVSQ